MLYLETETGFELWTNQAINNIRYHKSIAVEWSPEELAAIGLYAPIEPGIPAGYHSASFTVERIDGVVQYVHTLEATPTGE